MIRIREMTTADVAVGVCLLGAGNWNQTEADWRRFLSLEPNGCFVAEVDGCPAGTTTTVRFGPVAWIAMVVVAEEFRRRGVATQLMQHALAYLAERGVQTVRLDATAAGRLVYERIGFVAEYEVARYAGTGATVPAVPAVVPLSDHEFDAACAIDCRSTGTDRRRLLERLYAERPTAARCVLDGGAVTGVGWLRPGRRATFLGPCAAVTPEAGAALLQWAVGCCPQQPVLVDVPCDNREAVRWVEQAGLRVQRHFVRMARGPRIADRPDLIWATSGPEKG